MTGILPTTGIPCGHTLKVSIIMSIWYLYLLRFSDFEFAAFALKRVRALMLGHFPPDR